MLLFDILLFALCLTSFPMFTLWEFKHDKARARLACSLYNLTRCRDVNQTVTIFWHSWRWFFHYNKIKLNNFWIFIVNWRI